MCPMLEYLDMGFNVVDMCTVEAVAKIRGVCPKLHTIVLNCSNFGPHAAAEEVAKIVAAAFPSLRVCGPGESYEYNLTRMAV